MTFSVKMNRHPVRGGTHHASCAALQTLHVFKFFNAVTRVGEVENKLCSFRKKLLGIGALPGRRLMVVLLVPNVCALRSGHHGCL